jgi:small subunit ribosomal protein S1
MTSNGENTPDTQNDATPADATPAPEMPAAVRADDADDNTGNTVAAPAQDADDDSSGPGNTVAEVALPGDDVGNRAGGAPAAAAPNNGARREKKGRDNRGPRPEGGRGPRPEGAGAGQNRPPRAEPVHRAFKTGDKVRAKIVVVGADGVVCDLWGKEKGVLDRRELATDNPDPKVGDAVDVVVLQDGSRGGNLVVTRDPARAERAREMIVQAFNAGEPIEGLVTGHNKGGLELDIGGIRGFCPSSQVDVRIPSQADLQGFALKRELFRITQLIDGGREAVASRRALREGEVRERAEEAVKRLKVGERVKGIVVAVREHGLFVDLGGVEGRVQLSELSHDRGARPHDVAKVGDEIEAVILRIDVVHAPQPQAEKPEAVEAQPEGEAAPQAEGDANDKKGDRGDKRKGPRFTRLPEGTPRVELSRRQAEADPWADMHKRFPVGSVHKGKVARMQPFGAFIELEKGVDGLLHVSEIGEKRINHPNEVLKEAQEVTVRVTKIDRGQKRIGLALLPEGVTPEMLKNSVQPRVGLITTAKVVEHDGIGVWLQVENMIGKSGRALMLPGDTNTPRGTDLRKAIPLNSDVKVKIVEVDRGRIRVSIKAALQDEERQAYRAYQQQANSTSVGVSLADKLRKLNLPR